MMSNAICWYDQNISDVSHRYESLASETIHGWLVDLLPNPPALVLDVGAGTGRDALGWRRVACKWSLSSRPARGNPAERRYVCGPS
jgi:ubiquinone/menaquinone biosynthesis C-methylase UbiE